MLNILNIKHHILAFAASFLIIYVPVCFVLIFMHMSIDAINVANWPIDGRGVFSIFVVACYYIAMLPTFFKSLEDIINDKKTKASNNV